MIAESPEKQATNWLNAFENAIENQDAPAITSLFHEESYWRDLVSLTWNIITVEGRPAIDALARDALVKTCPRNWRLATGTATEAGGVIEAKILFETDHVTGKGYIRLREGLCWTLLTTADSLKGHEEKEGRTRPFGAQHACSRTKTSWQEKREARRAALGTTVQPFVVIIGGGQGGIALAARLKALDVPTLVLERHARPGDSWRNRYKSLSLHDPIWYDHMPYLPFPKGWPVYMPKDMVADWLESYVRIMDIDYWTASECTSATYDEVAKEWTVHVRLTGNVQIALRPKHVVFATGMSGLPNVPALPNAERFAGDMWHSSKHPGGKAFKGKKVVIVGSNNSAHDIACDLWECDAASVTMLQRSSTMVVSSKNVREKMLGALYSENAVEAGIPVDEADFLFASLPYKVLTELHKGLADDIRTSDADFYKRLTDVGFQLDFGDDESGLFLKYLRRGSGYYIDVGGSELIAKGAIKLQHGEIERVSEGGVILGDGTTLDADLIVFATGYGSMNGWVAQLVSQEVADKVGKVWGLGSDTRKDPGPWVGELRNMWKPTQQEGLWFQGGNLHQARHYSHFLALQLKARHVGLVVSVYGLQETFHIS